MNLPDSILIIEDTHNIMRDRKSDMAASNQTVSNLLNLSGRLLGYAMHQQINYIFHCDVQILQKIQ